MDAIPETQLAAELARALRELLTNGEEIHIDGLGSFKTTHRLSWVDKNERGDYVLLPPRDTVIFTAQ